MHTLLSVSIDNNERLIGRSRDGTKSVGLQQFDSLTCLNYKAILCSDAYRDALEAAVAYNSRLSNERRTRGPFYDAQTGLAQLPGKLWKSPKDRQPGQLPGQVGYYFFLELID